MYLLNIFETATVGKTFVLNSIQNISMSFVFYSICNLIVHCGSKDEFMFLHSTKYLL